MSGSERSNNQLNDSWPRFFGHWAAATAGYELKYLLPLLDPTKPRGELSHWHEWLIYGALISVLGGGVSSNVPLKPREIVKSLGIGFALNATEILKRLGGA